MPQGERDSPRTVPLVVYVGDQRLIIGWATVAKNGTFTTEIVRSDLFEILGHHKNDEFTLGPKIIRNGEHITTRNPNGTVQQCHRGYAHAAHEWQAEFGALFDVYCPGIDVEND